ncbi:TIR domain-containing protein [Cupriavidus basilensis]|uniref:TIR domain-containing protein n=1 Tax=Cupriavidus basilensis TaxID=68895 RepID=UPI0023E85BD1|nr:TIR domain-containing protein [Cupriavidus basilensis]MDF3883639.1 TIR domain-containing protein [Cupriavidus basilensis]
MDYGMFGGMPRGQVPVKHKVFVSYHHGRDQAYYDAFSTAFHDRYDVIHDNSLERRVDSDNVDYVMRRIRENYITGSSCTIVLVGAETWRRKYVDWEIQATLDKKHGLIGVYLPTAARDPNNDKIMVPGRLFDNIQSGFASWLSWSQITAGAEHLERFVADAKARSTSVIANTRDRLLRNA